MWQLAGAVLLLVSALAILQIQNHAHADQKRRAIFGLVAIAVLDLLLYAGTMPAWQKWEKIGQKTPDFASSWANGDAVAYAGWRKRIAVSEPVSGPITVANQTMWQATSVNDMPVARIDGYAGVKPRRESIKLDHKNIHAASRRIRNRFE